MCFQVNQIGRVISTANEKDANFFNFRLSILLHVRCRRRRRVRRVRHVRRTVPVRRTRTTGRVLLRQHLRLAWVSLRYDAYLPSGL